MGKIVFIGDSQVKGTSYGGVTTADTFAHKIGVANGYAAIDVINTGVNSDTSAGVLARLNADVIAHAPAVCVVMVGLNDWWNNVLVAPYVANMASIIDQLRSAGIRPVIMSSNVQRGPTADFFSYQKYMQAIQALCVQKGVVYVDLYREVCAAYLYLESAVWLGLYADVVHLSVAGHQFVKDFTARDQFTGIFSAPVTETATESVVPVYVTNGVPPRVFAGVGAGRIELVTK